MKYLKKIMAVMLTMVFMFVSLGVTGTSNAATGEAAKTAPAKVTNLKAHPSYLSVLLKWDKVDGADGYTVYQKVNGAYKKVADVKKPECLVTGLKKYVKQSFRVKSYVKDSNGIRESASVWVSGEPVREMTYKLTVKVSKSIRPKGGNGKYLKIKSGQTVEAYRFTAGRYAVIKDGKYYYIPKTYVRKAKGVYESFPGIREGC